MMLAALSFKEGWLIILGIALFIAISLLHAVRSQTNFMRDMHRDCGRRARRMSKRNKTP